MELQVPSAWVQRKDPSYVNWIGFFFNNSGAGVPQSVYRLGYGLDGPGFKSRQKPEIFLLYKRFRTTPRPSQPPVQLEAGSCPGVKRTGVMKLFTLPQLVRSLRMSGAKPLLPLYAFTACTGNTFLTLSFNYSFSSFYYTAPTGEKIKE
jgi:hypothetical protein